MGNQSLQCQDDKKILGLFARYKSTARRKYREFVVKGIESGRRPELVGGGLIRSVGGWKAAKKLLKGQTRIKGDERILGDSDFVQYVLTPSNESYSRRQRLITKGVDLRDVEKINIPILLVYESVFRVASMGTDNRYAPIDAPRKRIQILRKYRYINFFHVP